MEDTITRERIACELLGVASLSASGFAPCPGRGRHTSDDGEKDFRVTLDGAPTGYCFHGSCSAEVEQFNKELRRRIWFAEHPIEDRQDAPSDDLPKNEVAPVPDAEPIPNVPKYDEQKLREFVRNVPPVTRANLKAASPVKVEGGCLADFFDLLFADGERVAVFSNFFSQGDFLHVVGKGSCRLGRQRGVKAVPSDLPVRGKEGIWFLSNPVTGNWDVVNDKGERKYGRRSWQNVTTFRYAVLESDTAPEDLWLRALVKLPLPIVAMYSSGGKSIHALVRVDAGSKIQWDEIVRGKNDRTRTRGMGLIDLVCPLGADPAALTAVRLTRAPYCYREGTQPRGAAYVRYDPPRLQELIYLNPMRLNAPLDWRSILAKSGSAVLQEEGATK